MTLLVAWFVGTGIAVLAVVARQIGARDATPLAPMLGPVGVAGLNAAALVLVAASGALARHLAPGHVWIVALMVPAACLYAYSLVVALEARHHGRVPVVSHPLDGAVVSEVGGVVHREVQRALRVAGWGTLAYLTAVGALALAGLWVVVDFVIRAFTWNL